jgi:uncharacterized membrane-anchored protein YjiN (DUF445 family)
MNTNEYFLKISEYCNFNIDCVGEVVSDRKKLAKILGISNRKELDNVWEELSLNFADYVYKNYKKFPKEELAKFIVINMCDYNLKCVLETLRENGMQDMQDYMLDYFKKTNDIERVVNECDYDFECMLKKLKENGMQDKLDELLDYIKENYDIERIVNELIDYLSVLNHPEDLDANEFALPIIAWLEFSDSREREAVVLFDMLSDEIPFALTPFFDEMRTDYLYTYEEVFGEASEDIVNKISETVDEIYSRVEDRLAEMAKNLYQETLDIIKNNPAKYEIIGYTECISRLCYLLGIEKIPLVRVNWDEENVENEEDTENKLLNA